MASKQRLIDACGLVVKLAKRIGPMIISDRPAADIYKVMLSCIADAPTVDAVEVVRCKDCKHWNNPYCNHSESTMLDTQADDFCSYGERRAEK